MNDEELYAGREQTLVKHFVLRRYLERFAHIVGSRWEGITYVDCFSGPWNERSSELKDTSFAIALEELCKARTTLQSKGGDLRIRCFFLEKDVEAYAQLQGFVELISDVEVKTQNAELESAIGDALQFVRAGTDCFPFIFIDPTGWKGFGMSAITPLLRQKPGEVLINFMTGHIRRFIESSDEKTEGGFVELFGSDAFKTQLEGLHFQDRDDAIVRAYCQNVGTVGGYQHVCSAIVLHPLFDTTHFHLIYATRSPKGVEVFKDVEKQAMKVMEKARAHAQQRQREKKWQTQELFESEDLHRSRYYEALRDRYLLLARASVEKLLRERIRIPYDDAWALALCDYPLVWESDLKEWIDDWMNAGSVLVEGLTGKQRVPSRNKQHHLRWLKSVLPTKSE